jgi:hypothetical protein
MANSYANFTGLTPDNAPTNSRAVLDANTIVTVSLPSSASSTVNSSSIDLGDAVLGVPYSSTETVNLQVLAPALSTTILPDTRTMSYVVADSADNSSFTAIGTLATQTQTGASSSGASAATYTFKLPPSTRRYIRLQVTSGASTTDASATSATFQLAY